MYPLWHFLHFNFVNNRKYNIYSQFFGKLVTRASLSIWTGGSVSPVPATAMFGHLVIFIIAHLRRWRLYKFEGKQNQLHYSNVIFNFGMILTLVSYDSI